MSQYRSAPTLESAQGLWLLAVMFVVWCLITWYAWSQYGPGIGDSLGKWSESQARRWRAMFPWLFGFWVVVTGSWFVVGFVDLLGST